MNIKPKMKVVYECYRGGRDEVSNRLRKGSRVKLEFVGRDNYYFRRESGRGGIIVVDKDVFVKYYVPAAK